MSCFLSESWLGGQAPLKQWLHLKLISPDEDETIDCLRMIMLYIIGINLNMITPALDRKQGQGKYNIEL